MGRALSILGPDRPTPPEARVTTSAPAPSPGSTGDLDRATEILAEFVATTSFDDLPSEVVNYAKYVIADTVAVSIRGSLSPEVTALTARLTHDQSGRAIVLRPDFPRSSARAAAFLNATASCFIELDEGSRPTGHPAIHLLPAALSWAQEMRLSGRELLTAFILGYEVQARIQRAARLRTPVHCHGTLGNPATAAVIGKLVGWTGSQIASAMNCGASLATCMTYSSCHAGATARNIAPAVSAQHAFTIRELVESGFTAYDGALVEVFGQVLGDEFRAEELTDGLGDEFAILGNRLKFHATCGGAHPALDALADALGTRLGPLAFPWSVGYDLQLGDIQAIDVVTSSRDAELANLPRRNTLSAKYSIPFALGALIVRGCVAPDAFEPESLKDERIWDVARKTHVSRNADFDARWPNEAIAHVSVRLTSGRELHGWCTNPYGSPNNRADLRDVEAKFHWLLKDVLPSGQAQDLWDAALELDLLPDVSRYGI